jgi:hypothetical protein
MELSPSWEPANRSAIKNYPKFYGTGTFTTVSARAGHWSLSWARWIKYIPPHQISIKSMLMLSYHLRVPTCLFRSDLQNPYAHITLLHACYSPRPSHPSWLVHCNYARTRRRVQVTKLLVMQFSLTYYCFIYIRFKYSLRRPVLKEALIAQSV